MNDYSTKYKGLLFEQTLSRYRRERAAEFISSNNFNLWVEVGCGTLPLPNLVRKHRWIVIEPSAEFRALVSYENSFTYERIDDVPPIAERCGIIIDSLLHELADPVAMLKAYRRTFTHPDSIIRVNVPNAHSYHRQIAKDLGLIVNLEDVSATGSHLRQARVYTPNLLKSELTTAGLLVRKLSSSFPKFFTNAQMQAMMDNGIVDESVFLAMHNLDDTLGLFGAELIAVCEWQR